jgi:hypothetical protein
MKRDVRVFPIGWAFPHVSVQFCRHARPTMA